MFPSIGLRIQLEPELQEEPKIQERKRKRVYSSRVADFGENTFMIELPIDEHGGREPYPLGTSFTCWFIGEDGGQFFFKTSLVRRTEENIPLWVMNRPKEADIQRTQRRHNLRVEAHLDLAVRGLDDRRPYHYVTQTMDVSGGGLSFITPKEHEIVAGDKVRGYLLIPFKKEEITHSVFVGEVVRLFHPKEKNGPEVASVKFLAIPEREMEALVRFTYQRQIELYKRDQEM